MPRPSDGIVRAILGPTNTGKTSILRLLDYCLGASNYPDNPETVRQVRSAVAYTVGAMPV